jgi:hypothetical protein
VGAKPQKQSSKPGFAPTRYREVVLTASKFGYVNPEANSMIVRQADARADEILTARRRLQC